MTERPSSQTLQQGWEPIAPTCPDWCTDHVEMSDCSYHQSEEWLIAEHVLILVGPMDPLGDLPGDPGGVYFFGEGYGMPVAPLKVIEADAKVLEVRADSARLAELADALEHAVSYVREAKSCPVPEVPR